MLGTRKQLRDLAQLGQVAFIIGVAYVFYAAPVRTIQGNPRSGFDVIAGVLGIAFWVTAIVVLVSGAK
jgi:hypothetical protein